ncbi:DUF2142 domain-containing protein [Salinibacterium sp.]|uniref:DUF2142 domain-containing protein n=1 Tax=Salinibacterium sp. TaxID=1915057 RepID=UPI00286BEE4C|nr:DUF2142 domain-containing protein [Salinibacterium sp.]
MTAERQISRRPARTAPRFRWVFLAPLLAFIALGAWAFASPIGASPDDDYHLVSIWCADSGGELCAPAAQQNTRVVPSTFLDLICYVQIEQRSASCQQSVWSGHPVATQRGNFANEYPPIFYSTMHVFAGGDIQISALVMRLVSAAIFVALATSLAVLLPVSRRSTLLWGWLVTLVPLGMFLIPSNNPSGWAITGVGTAFLALLGWFETRGRRRWALGALYLVGTLMAAGSRGDGAVYAVGATVTVLILTSARTRPWALSAILPAVGIILAVALFSSAGQAGTGMTGITGSGVTNPDLPALGASQADPLGRAGLAAYNLLMLPFLWTGVWGTWSLGWFDTPLPAIVPWAATAAFIVVAFAGVGRLNWRKAIAACGVLIVLIVLPVYVLTVGGDRVGTDLQPRYLLPLIVLFTFVLLVDPAERFLNFSRVQNLAILGALTIANLIALQVNIRRYITGTDAQGFNLDSGGEWWWTAFPVGPNAVWVIGALAYAGLLATLWPQLRPWVEPALEGDRLTRQRV